MLIYVHAVYKLNKYIAVFNTLIYIYNVLNNAMYLFDLYIYEIN